MNLINLSKGECIGIMDRPFVVTGWSSAIGDGVVFLTRASDGRQFSLPAGRLLELQLLGQLSRSAARGKPKRRQPTGYPSAQAS